MIVYRICSAKYPENDGEGARLYGGRWNEKGTPVIYCASSISLCVLEVLVNSAALPHDMVSIEVDIPAKIVPERPPKLPPDWNSTVPSSSTQRLGTHWILFGKSVAFVVPSAVVPSENNILIYPLHPAFGLIKFSAPKPFDFDSRLK